MFKIDTNIDLNQISLTGMRAIVLLGLLIMAPRSLDEIKQALIKFKIIDKTHSDDTLRIDLSTIKAMGCKLSRPTVKDNYKYVLLKHPFALTIEDDEIRLLKRIYNKVKMNADVQLLIEYHDLFLKIASFIYDVEIKERLYGISLLKSYDVNMLKELLIDCAQERILNLIYMKPTTKKEEEKNVVAKKLVFQNDKLYLHCYDLKKSDFVVLQIKRILKINSRYFSEGKISEKSTKLKFQIKDFGIEMLSDEENIIKADDNGYVVEGSYFNEFYAMQRVLSFGVNCTVLEPLEFRKKVIAKLKEMRKVYDK